MISWPYFRASHNQLPLLLQTLSHLRPELGRSFHVIICGNCRRHSKQLPNRIQHQHQKSERKNSKKRKALKKNRKKGRLASTDAALILRPVKPRTTIPLQKKKCRRRREEGLSSSIQLRVRWTPSCGNLN